ncbi:hypothetical protein OG331_25150 [Streptomyces sp. NBC_01017]|uniref:hypothetical protein n=1 Tax=Streptomyces sp. NBC_01017 TaxID=2903721 RepID=UPI0038681F9B|nr:hypothetical protein OG331_25150 [Streptomyces sp. NBC_01017]
MNERFSYSGSAVIDGVQLPNVRLQENPPEGGLRSWEGSAVFHVSEAPEGFPANLDLNSPVLIELADGRRGQVLGFVNFDGTRWTIDLQGTGPAPN